MFHEKFKDGGDGRKEKEGKFCKQNLSCLKRLKPGKISRTWGERRKKKVVINESNEEKRARDDE